ncbi:unnamed protein product [Heterosigma akashiwo]
MPKNAFDYYASGANDMITLRENRAAYQRLRMRPRILRDVSKVDISTTILGDKISSPICVAPSAMQRMAHEDGENATARACAKSGTLMTLSSWSTIALEEVAQAGAAAEPSAPRWFQLYVYKDRGVVLDLVLAQRAVQTSGHRGHARAGPPRGRRAQPLQAAHAPHHGQLCLEGRRARLGHQGRGQGLGPGRLRGRPHRPHAQLGGHRLAQAQHLHEGGGEGRDDGRGRPHGLRGERGRHLGLQPRRAPAGHLPGHHRDGARDRGRREQALRDLRGRRRAARHRRLQGAGPGVHGRVHWAAGALGPGPLGRGGRGARAAAAARGVRDGHAAERVHPRGRDPARHGLPRLGVRQALSPPPPGAGGGGEE